MFDIAHAASWQRLPCVIQNRASKVKLAQGSPQLDWVVRHNNVQLIPLQVGVWLPSPTWPRALRGIP